MNTLELLGEVEARIEEKSEAITAKSQEEAAWKDNTKKGLYDGPTLLAN